MPYIDRDLARELLALPLGNLERVSTFTPGALNFALSQVAIQYLHRKGVNYTDLNDVMGAFTAAQQEFYRRVVVPYEEIKMKQNGDIYGDLK